MFSPRNLESVGLLHDIIPDKKWTYCATCARPVVDNEDIAQHPFAESILETLGCHEHNTTEQYATDLPTFIEIAVFEFVFPYNDDFVHGTKFNGVMDMQKLGSLHVMEWVELRDRIKWDDKVMVWTRKTVTYYDRENVHIVPRHPSLGLTFVD